MDWPAKSPDIASIEHPCDLLVCRVGGGRQVPQTVAQMRQALTD